MKKKQPLIHLVVILLLFFTVPSLSASVTHHDFEVDPLNSKQCTECHDEMVSEASQHHPVNISFPLPKEGQLERTKNTSGKQKIFKTREDAEREGIRFFQGQIVCLSCHNLKKNASKHLVIENRESRLCRACHRI